METEEVKLLRKIKEGTISNSLTPFSEIEDLMKSGTERETLYRMIEFNEKCRFPKYVHLSKARNSSRRTIEKHMKSLKKFELAFNVVIPELTKVFSIRKGNRVYLPESLDYATWYDMSKRRFGHPSGITTWRKRKKLLRFPNWHVYNLARVEKNGIPVWVDVFRFLKHYETIPKT